MANYVDRDLILKVLTHRVKGNEDNFIVIGTNNTLDLVEEWVRSIPTVDAVEVDHTQIVDGECKKCGWFGDCVEARSHNFCPGCGRKVRRAEDVADD